MRRNPKSAAAATLLGVLLCAAPARSELYHWRDANGVDHVVADLESVPPQQRDAARDAAAGSTVNRMGNGAAPRPASPPAGRSQAIGVAPPAARAPSSELPGGHDEAWWRDHYRSYLDDVARLDAQAKACAGMGPAVRYNRRADWHLDRNAYDRKVDALEACDAAADELEARKRALDRFEEDAHRNGVPPGWLR
jgi:hypothetical protein